MGSWGRCCAEGECDAPVHMQRRAVGHTKDATAEQAACISKYLCNIRAGTSWIINACPHLNDKGTAGKVPCRCMSVIMYNAYSLSFVFLITVDALVTGAETPAPGPLAFRIQCISERSKSFDHPSHMKGHMASP